MKAMTKALCCLSIGSSLLAAPKPLLNPFADTMNTQSAPQTTSSLPTQAVQTTSNTSAGGNSNTRPSNTQNSYDSTSSLPTMENVGSTSQKVMTQSSTTRLVVKGQGVAPSFTQSPAQAFALAKRAAMVDAYRLLGEKIQGVKVEGQDLIKNMMVKRSQVRTEVNAMIREATVIETEFKDGLCEVEVELIVSGSRWHKTLSHAFAE
jgi:hypothetical protein